MKICVVIHPKSTWYRQSRQNALLKEYKDRTKHSSKLKLVPMDIHRNLYHTVESTLYKVSFFNRCTIMLLNGACTNAN